MIPAEQVIPLLLAAVPSFAGPWQEIEDDPLHLDEDAGRRLHYLDAGEVARHLVDLQRRGADDEIAAAFAVIERLHVEGDPYVRELATMGYLEGVQNACSHTTDVPPAAFERHLGPESLRWWRGLDAFWAGEEGTVHPHPET